MVARRFVHLPRDAALQYATMAPGTHAVLSWWIANVAPLSRRDRLLVFALGLAPDLDGLPLLVSTEAYVTYHHVLCHNLPFGLLCTACAIATAQARLLTAALVFLSFHLHLACDYFGSGGPGDYIWVLPYFYPLVGGWSGGQFVGPAWYWNPWQWPLNGWPNLLITLLGIVGALVIALRLGRTPVEFLWRRADEEVCRDLRKWFRAQGEDAWTPGEARLVRSAFLLVWVATAWACLLAGMQATGPRPL